jgi:hypothetical protein
MPFQPSTSAAANTEKSYPCSFCNSTFQTYKRRNNHQRIHTINDATPVQEPQPVTSPIIETVHMDIDSEPSCECFVVEKR